MVNVLDTPPELTFLLRIDTDARNSIIACSERGRIIYSSELWYSLAHFSIDQACILTIHNWYCTAVGTDLPRMYVSARGPFALQTPLPTSSSPSKFLWSSIFSWSDIAAALLICKDILYVIYVDLCSELDDNFKHQKRGLRSQIMLYVQCTTTRLDKVQGEFFFIVEENQIFFQRIQYVLYTHCSMKFLGSRPWHKVDTITLFWFFFSWNLNMIVRVFPNLEQLECTLVP